MSELNNEFIDQLIAGGVSPQVVEILALGFPHPNPLPAGRGDKWLEGLNAAAVLMNHGTLELDWSTLPAPWDTICPALAEADAGNIHQVLPNALAGFDSKIQIALIQVIGNKATQLAARDREVRKADLTSGPNQYRAAKIEQTAKYMQPVDPKLVTRIQKKLNDEGPKEKRRKEAGEILIDWLVNNGKFIKTLYGTTYYLYRKTHRLFALNSNVWHAWLYLLTGSNPASTDFKYFSADCLTAAQEGADMEVVRVAHWDSQEQILRVSRFDGLVYRLDGMTMEIEANGDGPVLFDDAPYWATYEPDFTAEGKVLDWSTNELAHWEENPEELSLLYRSWWIASFFTEICPTRPLLVIKGEKGSGKSMSLRIMLRLIFGPGIDVVGVPEKADAFVTLTSNSHLIVLDNMDSVNKDIRDKIASLTTGKTDQIRELYTTNESRIIRYRCWLAITSRTPDTLQRDDLADRLIILPVSRIDDKDRTRESRFLSDTLVKRNQWWGDTLTMLNSVVAEIRANGLPDRGGHRMEDWAAIGTVLARVMDQVEVWETGIKGGRERQAEFLLEDDVVVQAIEAWLSNPLNMSSVVTTRSLYTDSRTALYGGDRPDGNWPRSVRSFGRRLAGMRRELQEHFRKSNVEMTWSDVNGSLNYRFSPFD